MHAKVVCPCQTLPPGCNQQAAHDRKGGVMQNCLAICGFDMTFYYIFSGSAADSTVFYDAHITDCYV